MCAEIKPAYCLVRMSSPVLWPFAVHAVPGVSLRRYSKNPWNQWLGTRLNRLPNIRNLLGMKWIPNSLSVCSLHRYIEF